ncbi:uncharacterized protein LOC143830470 [Paroedura picta]|uniref:uncharacterized protein LOC143830470 n=1 Tax=Paroedura picta TaxID=143630 RepID=UPI0040566F09
MKAQPKETERAAPVSQEEHQSLQAGPKLVPVPAHLSVRPSFRPFLNTPKMRVQKVTDVSPSLRVQDANARPKNTTTKRSSFLEPFPGRAGARLLALASRGGRAPKIMGPVLAASLLDFVLRPPPLRLTVTYLLQIRCWFSGTD